LYSWILRELRIVLSNPCRLYGCALVNPHGTPTETKTSPAPFVHAATRAERFRLRDAYGAFLYRYRIAAKKLKDGDLTAEFPPDCFPPRFPAADRPRPPT
jgi:hypothetical protein